MKDAFRPNLFIVGAARCGTTTIHDILERTPEVCMSRPKETRFYHTHFFERGLEFHREKNFSHWEEEKWVGEGATRKFDTAGVPERLYQVNPDARLLFIFRNPIERAHSHWWFRVQRGQDVLDFDQAVQKSYELLLRKPEIPGPRKPKQYGPEIRKMRPRSSPAYLRDGYYLEHLQRFVDRFPREQIHLMLFDDLRTDAMSVARGLWSFLELEEPADFKVFKTNSSDRITPGLRLLLENAWPNPLSMIRALRVWLRRNQSRPPIDAATRAWLLDHYSRRNRELGDFMGRDLGHWK